MGGRIVLAGGDNWKDGDRICCTGGYVTDGTGLLEGEVCLGGDGDGVAIGYPPVGNLEVADLSAGW